MYHPLPNRFKDYISTPKPNGYQSLHTTVIGREAIPFEVQIRTWDMDRMAEYGIAAHWKYKAGITGSSDKLDERLAWVRQLLESQRSSADATDLLSDIKSDLAARGSVRLHAARRRHQPARGRDGHRLRLRDPLSLSATE